MLTVGIPREIKSFEKRVALTPLGVEKLCRQGIPVCVEKDAGKQSCFEDGSYVQAGACIVQNAAEVYKASDLIQKVKEPQASEYALLKNKIIFSFLHLASQDNCELVKALQECHVTAIAYETVNVDGKVPILAPMSEIAGGLAAAYGALFLRVLSSQKGSVPENLLKQMEDVALQYPNPPNGFTGGSFLIFGGGTAGQKAAEMAFALQGTVTLIEKDAAARELLKQKWEQQPSFKVFDCEDDYIQELHQADILIGCVHQTGHRAQQVMEIELMRAISAYKKKIIMDVAVDQGGNFPETHATPYGDPIYRDSCGNWRFAVANMPSFCGRQASEALTQVTWPYTLAMAQDLEAGFKRFPELRRAVNLQKGLIVLDSVREAHQP